MNFLCSQCAACCKSAGMLNAQEHGLPVKKDGSCGHLVGNICSIYEDRPDICRVEKMLSKKDGQSRKEYYIEATKSCHDLIDLHGLGDEYKINIEEYNLIDDNG